MNKLMNRILERHFHIFGDQGAIPEEDIIQERHMYFEMVLRPAHPNVADNGLWLIYAWERITTELESWVYILTGREPSWWTGLW